MNYSNINISDLLETYMYAGVGDFEGIICDADKRQVEVVFNEDK